MQNPTYVEEGRDLSFVDNQTKRHPDVLNLATTDDLIDADVKFSGGTVLHFTLLHVMYFTMWGPMIQLPMRLIYGSWNFALNLGFGFRGAAFMFKMIQIMQWMMEMVPICILLYVLSINDWDFMEVHMKGFDLFFFIMTLIQKIFRSLMIANKYATYSKK